MVELSRRLSFRQNIAYLVRGTAPTTQLLTHVAAFCQLELHRYREGIEYVAQRGLHDPTRIEEFGIGYARGGTLRPHLQALGYSLEQLLQASLINSQGADTFCQLLPCAPVVTHKNQSQSSIALCGGLLSAWSNSKLPHDGN